MEVVMEVKVIVHENPSGRELIGVSRTKMTRKGTHLDELTGMVPCACQLLAPAKRNSEHREIFLHPSLVSWDLTLPICRASYPVYCIRIRTRVGIYCQIYPFA